MSHVKYAEYSICMTIVNEPGEWRGNGWRAHSTYWLQRENIKVGVNTHGGWELKVNHCVAADFLNFTWIEKLGT